MWVYFRECDLPNTHSVAALRVAGIAGRWSPHPKARHPNHLHPRIAIQTLAARRPVLGPGIGIAATWKPKKRYAHSLHLVLAHDP